MLLIDNVSQPMPYEPLHHKYRPKSFSQLVGQEAIATTLTNAIRTAKIAPAYLFTGPRGTGKTSSARILAKSLNCLSSNHPTAEPCGVCDVCLGIANGSTLDVIEIDAASNTGVDNIREIIERAQFAPVQCRYKVYVVDECLTGDSLVSTSEGHLRIDNPSIKGKQVLSYNDSTGEWEYKKVLRWLERGERQTQVIKTTNREIRCTLNHLIRTEQGWIPARDVKEGVKILSPVNVDAVLSFTDSALMDVPEGLLGGTSSKLIGLQQWDIPQPQSCIPEVAQARDTITYGWEQTAVENGWQISNNIPLPQWITSLETVESVHLAGVQKVYDLEVEDNHNFVANGLTVHNCHMLSTAAFNALLKTLEEPPKHVVFVLATTDPQRVLPTIISRCQRFDFRRIPLEAMVAHLTTIAGNENINITPEAITLVGQLSQGGLRDAESLLDQLSLLAGDVTPDRVWDLVGSVSEKDLLALVRAIASNNPEATLDCLRQILDRGREPLTVLQNLAAFYRDLLIARTAPNRGDLVACTQETWQAMCQLIQSWDMSLILAAQQHLRSCEVQVKNTTQPRLWLEVALLGLLPSAIAPPVVTGVSTVVTPMSNPTPVAATEARNPTPQPLPQTPPPQPTPQPIQQENPTPTPPITPSPQPAISEPVPATPVPQPQPPDSSQEFDLPTIWKQVLAHIEPASTRGILGAMCYLMEFDGNVACLGIKGKWMTRVQTELPKIHAAFQSCFQRQIMVKLQAGNSSPPPPRQTPPPSQTPPQTPRSVPNPTPLQPSTPPAANYNSGYNSANYKNGNNNIVPTSSAATPISNNSPPAKTEPPKTVPQAVQTEQPQQPPTITTDNWQDDEVAIAAQRLAEFFRGEVVRFAEEAGVSESTEHPQWEEEID